MAEKVEENLRRSALLNTLAASIDYGAKLVVSFIINPLIITSLGAVYFGVWQVISQLNSYMATADIQAGNTLRFLLAKDRSSQTELQLKQYVSAALYSNFFFLPLYLLVGALIVWFSPHFASVGYAYYTAVRAATGFLVLAFITAQFFYLFESTLSGMNLSYKRLGVKAAVIVTGGLLTWLSLYFGYGIVGLAIVQVITALATGLTLWVIVKKQLPWFEFVKVSRTDILQFVRKSSLFVVMKFVSLLNRSSDFLLLGFLTGPKLVAVYSVTKFAMNASLGFIKTALSSGTIGIGKYLGEKQFEKIVKAREQVGLMQWSIIAFAGSLICLFNRSFVSLWTSADLFAGAFPTLLIVCVAALNILMHFDSNLINISLDIKKKIRALLLSSIVTVALIFILVPRYQITGLLVAMLSGLIFLNIYFAVIADKLLHSTRGIMARFLNRKSIVCAILIAICYYSSTRLTIHSWSLLLMSVTLAALLVALAIWGVMISKEERTVIKQNLQRAGVGLKH